MEQIEPGVDRGATIHRWARLPARAALVEASLIATLALILNLAGNGQFDLFDRDEPRYAGCMRAMRQSGDYLHPTFNGVPRYHKPILIYWLMLAGTAVGGDNPFGLRLVSALSGATTCLLTWAWGRQVLGPGAGRLAALLLATAPIMVVESKMATTDAFLTLLLTSCQVALWILNRGPSKLAAAVFWTALALSVLTKGPVGVALVAAAGLVSWAVRGPSTCWNRLHWKWGLAVFAIVTLPWFLVIGIMTRGEFLRVAIGQQIVARVVQPLEEHRGFPGYYLVTTLLAFYPWSTLLPAAVLGAWVRRRSTPDLAVLLGWVIGPWILLECVRTKLVHYYLPAYPACALLTAWLVETLARAGIGLRHWPLGRVGLGTFAALGVGLTLALVHLGLFILPRPIAWPCLVVAAVVAVGTSLGFGLFRGGHCSRAVWALVGTWAVVLLILSAWLVPAAEPYRISTALGPRMAALLAREGAEPITADYKEPSLIVSLRRPVAPLLTRAWLIDQVKRHRKVVMALLPGELARFRGYPGIETELSETVHGFNLSKGRVQTLHLVVLRPASDPGVARRPRQEALVE